VNMLSAQTRLLHRPFRAYVISTNIKAGVTMSFLKSLWATLASVFKYSGRSDRLEQWVFVFMTAVFAVGIGIFVEAGFAIKGYTLLALLIIGFWIFLAHISLCVRRLHDVGRSGFYMMLPLTGACVMLIGYVGENGTSSYFTDYLTDYGWIVRRLGQSLVFISASMLTGIFAKQGDEDTNAYGDPV